MNIMLARASDHQFSSHPFMHTTDHTLDGKAEYSLVALMCRSMFMLH